jgi:hypothetical protein
MEAKKPEIVEDPNFAATQASAQRSLITNLQTQAEIDTASIMARFGTKQALAAAGMDAPVAAAPATPAYKGAF